MVETFEENLYNFFSEIIYVESNPAVLHTQIIEKIDGKIKSKFLKESYDLHKVLINKQISDLTSTIIERIKNISVQSEVEFHSKNIFQKLFSNKKKNLEKYLLEFISDEYFLILHPVLKNYVSQDFNTIIFDDQLLQNSVIVAKKSKIILNKNIKVDEDNIEIEFWINSDDYKVIDLK